MITKEQLENIGFLEYGQEENDIYHQIAFSGKLKFNISFISGNFENGIFWIYSNDERYDNIEDVKSLLLIVGGENIYSRY